MDRDHILEAAAQIFSQKGYHAASMQDIAEAVSLQKASLYHHVSSKQEILFELLERALDLLIEEQEHVMALPLEPEEKLRQAMKAYMQILTDHQALSAVLLMEHRSLEPHLRLRHIPKRDRYEGLWRTLIQEGKTAGVFTSTDPVFATRALLGVMNWTITWYKPGGLLTAEQIANEYADLIIRGLLQRTDEPGYPVKNGTDGNERASV
jgi:AcrR family transcriptional regulator